MLRILKPGFPERFLEVLEHYDISKELIEVEIAETLVAEELQQQMVKKTLDIFIQDRCPKQILRRN